MDLVKPLIILIASGTAVFALTLFAATSKADVRGWRFLKPSAMHWTAAVGSALLCLLMAYIRLFVGSSRADAETQMTILTGLIMAFGTGSTATAILMHTLRRRAIRWRGNTLAFSGTSGMEQRDFNDIAQMKPNFWGQTVLIFFDGTILRIDPNATGAGDLLGRIIKSQESV